MSEEEKSLSMDTAHHDVVTVVNVEHQSNPGAGSSSQAGAKVYATTAEAIANFKPTHREVISGIAPHVFDERKRRRSQRRASSLSRTYWCVQGGEKRPSPLRGTTTPSAGDEHSIHLDQPDPQHCSKENTETKSICAVTSGAANVQLQEKTTHNNGTIEKLDSDTFKTDALWKYLRIDTHLFKLKTMAVKLKSTRTR